MKILNLFSGIGGNRKLWTDCDITSVEKEENISKVYSNLFPDDTLIIGDAYEYLKLHYQEFDFIWASPPCQKHSKMMKATRHKVADYPDFRLYELIIFLQHFFKGKWVVENVVPYYEPLIKPTAKIGRHLIWSNFHIRANEVVQPKGFISKSNLQGKKEMQEWLGLNFDENIYYGDNHCPVQILRNCVHPKLGLQVFQSAYAPITQTTLKL